METGTRLVFFTAAIVAASLVGGAVPLVANFSRRRLQVALSLAAGLLLGAAFFHMIPEAVERAGPSVAYAIPVGFIALFLLERYLIVHVCAPDDADCDVHVFGAAAFVGIGIHSLTEGIALGASLTSTSLAMPVFTAVAMHKAPESFALAIILRGAKYKTRTIMALLVAFALTFPVGATLAHWVVPGMDATVDWRSLAVAFSAGTFLHISFSDLLPEAHRHREGRVATSLAAILGLAMMYALTAWV